MAYGDFKDLARRAASDNVLREKPFNIARNPKYDGNERVFAAILGKCFDKKSKGGGTNNEVKQNEKLAEELHKPIIEKFKKRKVYSSFKDNIWGAYLADMQLISKFNKWTRFLLCVIDIFRKFAWVVPLKDKEGITTVSTFQNILDNATEFCSMKKTNKIWVDKGSEFHNNSFKKWLKDNDIEMYSTQNVGKSVVAEKLIRTSKIKCVCW